MRRKNGKYVRVISYRPGRLIHFMCSTVLTRNYSKKYQVSRIRPEEIQQEILGIKNLPRRTIARNTRRQESVKKKYSKKTMALRHLPRRNPAQERE